MRWYLYWFVCSHWQNFHQRSAIDDFRHLKIATRPMGRSEQGHVAHCTLMPSRSAYRSTVHQ
jgi:hypothetical protein